MSLHETKNVTCLRECPTGTPLWLSGGELVVPNASQYLDAKRILQTLQIKCIINVSSGVKVNDEHLELYSDIGMYYIQIPIDDTEEQSVPKTFLPAVLRAYRRHRHHAVLVNCSAGINRSALAAAAILWSTTNPRPWKTGQELVQDMRRRQLQYRRLPLLLKNRVFRQHLYAFIVTDAAHEDTPTACDQWIDIQ